MWTERRTDRRNTDRQTDKSKLIVALRNVASAPKNCYIILVLSVIALILKILLY
jgi:hypothetical protein